MPCTLAARRLRCAFRLVVLLPVILGCASARASRAREDGRSDGAIRVVIENYAWLDVNIYVESASGARWRIGTVVTGQQRLFVVRHALVSQSFRLIADPIGSSDRRVTDPLIASPGVTAYWRIGNSAATSFTFVR
jgi:hypothetical protein